MRGTPNFLRRPLRRERIGPLPGRSGKLEACTISELRVGPLIIGHRGAAGHAPENTRASFEAALGLGVDAVEFDVQFTHDGCPVIFHDETMERMTGVPARIPDHTRAALSGFDLGFLYGERFRGERLPAVEEIAKLMPAAIELHVELKDYRPVSRQDLERLIEVLEQNGGLQRAIISSPHEEQLSDVARLRPEVRRALLVFRGVRVAADAARRAAYLGCAAVNPNYTLVDSDLVSICHKHSMKVFAFTVNERGTMRTLETMGVDGFFTDYPDRIGGRAS